MERGIFFGMVSYGKFASGGDVGDNAANCRPGLWAKRKDMLAEGSIMVI
jgi:hypothetical protein